MKSRGLAQLIELPIETSVRRIEVAFANADSVLARMQERYGNASTTPTERVRSVRRSIAQTRRGIRIMRASVGALAAPFESWREHACEGASRGIEEALSPTTKGLGLINAGMQRLWRLVIL